MATPWGCSLPAHPPLHLGTLSGSQGSTLKHSGYPETVLFSLFLKCLCCLWWPHQTISVDSSKNIGFYRRWEELLTSNCFLLLVTQENADGPVVASCSWWRRGKNTANPPYPGPLRHGFNQPWIKNIWEKSAFLLNIDRLFLLSLFSKQHSMTTTYIVLGVTSSLEVTAGVQEVFHVDACNGIGLHWIWVSEGSWNQSQQIQRDSCAERDTCVCKDCLCPSPLHR